MVLSWFAQFQGGKCLVFHTRFSVLLFQGLNVMVYLKALYSWTRTPYLSSIPGGDDTCQEHWNVQSAYFGNPDILGLVVSNSAVACSVFREVLSCLSKVWFFLTFVPLQQRKLGLASAYWDYENLENGWKSKEWIERVAYIPVDGQQGPADVCVIELGGTIGDIESMPFIEALGQFSYHVGPGNFCLIHVSLVPVLNVVGEQKTKPTQHSVRGLRGLGLTPNILACRSSTALDENVKEKLSQFCHVPAANIITLYDVSNIWRIPLLLRDQKAHEAIFKALNFSSRKPSLEEWTARADLCDKLHDPVRIAMVGKYTCLSDSYLSVLKALLHASVACHRKLIVVWVAANDLEDATAEETPDVHKAAWDLLKGADGILVPGGFGDRGVQGKILAAKYAREKRIPFLGICLGLQIAVIEYARSVLNLQDANSTEFDPETRNPCVIFMPEGSKTHMGGTMRLGSRRTYFQVAGCKSSKLYGNPVSVDERHRHRYEVNPDMIGRLENAGLSFVGKDETGCRMEIVELPSHPFYVGVQFHPEFKSRPGKPSALFLGLIAAASGKLEALLQKSEHANNSRSKIIPSNGPPPLAMKFQQNGNPNKHASRLNGVHANGNGNGNGVHI